MATKSGKFILLTFDVEEFDLPGDYQIAVELKDQLEIAHKGLLNIIQLLSQYPEVKATFFTTALFAKHFPETIKAISITHEVASHTYSNAYSNKSDLLLSRNILENIIAKPVLGIRMPQMQEVDMDDLLNAGYSYDSSINPTWIPGRYNNFRKPRNVFIENGMTRIPASVSGFFRIPLFWLSFKNLPHLVFNYLAQSSLNKYGFLNLYFHPWEFTDISKYDIPFYIKTGSNLRLLKKLNRFLNSFSQRADFITLHDFARIRSATQLQNSSSIASHL